MHKIKNTLTSYAFPFLLLLAISLGGLTGYWGGAFVMRLKPLGDIFLNLLLTAIVPLIFFSIASAIARACSQGMLGKIFGSMIIVFIITGVLASIYALTVVSFFPPAEGVHLSLATSPPTTAIKISEQLVGIFTVSNFSQLLSHEHILALIIFAVLVGLATSQLKEEGQTFLNFLITGEKVFMRLFDLIMYYAPIGFFAYFAVLVHELGPQLMTNYVRVGLLYYSTSFIYFLIIYTLYAYLANPKHGVTLFWRHVFLPMFTALATCSSAASIPANLSATKKMQVPAEIADTTIPLGSLTHKDGSVIGGVFKIAFLFGLFQLDFSGASTLLIALGISLLVGTVMGAIPSGGLLGELLILNAYGFPPSVLIAIAAISVIIDPLATMLNVTGNTVASMLIARLVRKREGSWANDVR